MDLSWEILTVVASFLDKEEVKRMRIVSRFWNRVLTPVICQTLIYDPHERDQLAHKSFLKNYGLCAKKLVFGFLGLGNTFSLSEAEVEFLSASLPKLTRLEFNIYEEAPERCAIGLLALCQGLSWLKHLELRGFLDRSILKILKPLTSRLTAMSLGRLVCRDGTPNTLADNVSSVLPHLELPLAKELRFYEDGYTTISDALVQRFPNLESLYYCWNLESNDSWMLFDVKKSLLRQFCNYSLNDVNNCSVEFDVGAFENKPKPIRAARSPAQQVEYIRALFDSTPNESSLGTLPPVKSMAIAHGYDQDGLIRVLRQSKAVPLLVLDLTRDADLDFPESPFSSHSLVLKAESLTPSRLPWASQWFPNLTDLYINALVPEENLDELELRFKSLVRFYTCRVQPTRFWPKLLASSQQLRKVLVAQGDPNLTMLIATYPNVHFGHWTEERQRRKENIGSMGCQHYHFYKIDLGLWG